MNVTDSLGCKANKSAGISSQGGSSVTVTSKTDVNCYGGNNGSCTISINGNGPYQIDWSNGKHGTAIFNLVARVYQVSVTDANGCRVIEDVTIIQPDIISINSTVINPSYGNNNGGIYINVSYGLEVLQESRPCGSKPAKDGRLTLL